MKKVFLLAAGISVFTIVNSQVISTSKLNPYSETPDTTKTKPEVQSSVEKTEVNSGSKTMVITNIPAEATKKEEQNSEPVTNSSAKKPK